MQNNGIEKYEGELIKRVGNAIMLIPKQNSWQPLLDAAKRFSPDFMSERDQPKGQQERENL